MAEIGGKTAENCGNWWFSKNAKTITRRSIYRKRAIKNCRKREKTATGGNLQNHTGPRL